MGFGFAKVIGRSIVKALKQTSITVGTAGALVAGYTLQNPELMMPIWAAVGGPIAAPLILMGLSAGGQAIIDAILHRDKMKPSTPTRYVGDANENVG